MTALKVIKWIAVILVMPWLVFMVISVTSGGSQFVRMGESAVSLVQSVTLKLSTKADSIKAEADEWKEKITGKKAEVKADESLGKDEKPPEKKKRKRVSSAQAPLKEDDAR